MVGPGPGLVCFALHYHSRQTHASGYQLPSYGRFLLPSPSCIRTMLWHAHCNGHAEMRLHSYRQPLSYSRHCHIQMVNHDIVQVIITTVHTPFATVGIPHRVYAQAQTLRPDSPPPHRQSQFLVVT